MERAHSSASNAASYSHFSQVDLSRNFDKLQTGGSSNQPRTLQSSSDSSPIYTSDTTNSSPYYSNNNSGLLAIAPRQRASWGWGQNNNPYFRDRVSQPPHRQFHGQTRAPNSTILEESNRVQSHVPFCDNSTGFGARQLEIIVPVNSGYSPLPSPLPYFVNREVEFFLDLIPQPLQRTLVPYSNAMMTVSARVIHSSRSAMNVELQKMEPLQRIRCSFTPSLAGSYSLLIYYHRIKPHQHGPQGASVTGLLCPPIQLAVNRNYAISAGASTTPSIRLPENGDKYWGIKADKTSDKLYVSDRTNHDIIVIDAITGTQLRRFGTEYLFRPTGMAVDTVHKRMLICDKDNHRVVITSMDGVLISSFGSMGYGDGKFSYPWDIDISPDGKIIAVSDSNNHRVQFFDRFGNYLTKFSVFEHSPFEYKKLFDCPRGIVFGLNGKCLFVTDFQNKNVVRINMNNMEFRLLMNPGKMRRPQGIVIDDVGCLLVCDSCDHCVTTIKDTDLKTPIVRVGHQFLFSPTDIDILREGRVAVLGKSGIVNFF